MVTGATGNVGRTLVADLVAAGEQVTAVSRHKTDQPAGVRHHEADLADADTVRPALKGATALFLLVPGGGEGVDPQALLNAATSAGVKGVVLLSSQGVRTRPGAPSHAHLDACEAAVRRSGLEWTVLRPGGFASNAYAWAESVRTHRMVAAPFADVALPVIDPTDIAACATVALRGGHAEQTYELTGPAPITPQEQAAAIGAALGESVRFTALTRDAAATAMRAFMPSAVVEGTLDILGQPTTAEQRVSPDVQRVLGREPRTFTDWATANAAAFR